MTNLKLIVVKVPQATAQTLAKLKERGYTKRDVLAWILDNKSDQIPELDQRREVSVSIKLPPETVDQIAKHGVTPAKILTHFAPDMLAEVGPKKTDKNDDWQPVSFAGSYDKKWRYRHREGVYIYQNNGRFGWLVDDRQSQATWKQPSRAKRLALVSAKVVKK